ncbi:MAG: hypothetical protein IPM18_12755 [Phycisphaerales bacterium]|nr:hypothetical protein [Phycisphaerales bacterium]
MVNDQQPQYDSPETIVDDLSPALRAALADMALTSSICAALRDDIDAVARNCDPFTQGQGALPATVNLLRNKLETLATTTTELEYAMAKRALLLEDVAETLADLRRSETQQ